MLVLGVASIIALEDHFVAFVFTAGTNKLFNIRKYCHFNENFGLSDVPSSEPVTAQSTKNKSNFLSYNLAGSPK